MKMRKTIPPEGTKYSSKIDRSFYVIMAVAAVIGVGCLAYYLFVRHLLLVGLIGTWALIALLLIFLPQYRATYYIIGEDRLFIKNGFFEKVSILYRQLLEVSQEKEDKLNGYSKVALSKDRVYIRYRVKKKQYLLEISPEDKEGFLKELEAKRIAVPSRKAEVGAMTAAES